MHLENSGKTSKYDEVENDAPSNSEPENDYLGNGFHEDADNELSDSDDDLAHNVEAFLNPVYDINDLNIHEEDEDDTDDDSNNVEEDPVANNVDGLNFNDQEGNEENSQSESSDSYQEDHQDINAPNDSRSSALSTTKNDGSNDPQSETSTNLKYDNFNDPQPGTSRYLENRQQGTSNIVENEDSVNTQQGAGSLTMHFCVNAQQCESCNPENKDSNNSQNPSERYARTENYDSSRGYVFGSSQESIETLSISIPDSSYCYAPYNAGFETPELFDNNAAGDSGYRASYSSHYHDLDTNYTPPSSSVYGTSGYADHETLPTFGNFVSGTSVFNTSPLFRYDPHFNPDYATRELPTYSATHNPTYLPPFLVNNGYVTPRPRHDQLVPSVNSHSSGYINTHSNSDSNNHSTDAPPSFGYPANGLSIYRGLGLPSNYASHLPNFTALGLPTHVSSVPSSDHSSDSTAMNHHYRSRNGAQETFQYTTAPSFSGYGTQGSINHREPNLYTGFDSTGHSIDRDNLEQVMLRLSISDRRYIPVVRLEFERISNDGDDTPAEPQPRPGFSNEQGPMTQSRFIGNPTRSRGHGRSHGRGYSRGYSRSHGRGHGRAHGRGNGRSHGRGNGRSHGRGHGRGRRRGCGYRSGNF